MPPILLDGNLLVALVVTDHVHHRAARAWWALGKRTIASTPITQGTLIRLLVRSGASGPDAALALTRFTEASRCEFWPDDLDYDVAMLTGVIGHRQVTDAYLVALAKAHDGRLATFDAGLYAFAPEVVELVAS